MKHASVPRFSHTFVIYEGGGLPAQYHGKLFGVEPLQSRVVCSDLQLDGTSFQTSDIGHPLESRDPWCRPVDIQVGPDGAVYVADFYEQRIDHASHHQGRIHRESGRIYRLRGPDAPSTASFDLAALSSSELVQVLRHENKWYRQTALRIFGDRKDESVIPELKQAIADNEGQFALEAVWALNLSGGLSDEMALTLLDHRDPQVRLWTVRLLCDDKRVSAHTAAKLAKVASAEKSPHVRSQLASSARRLPAEQGLPIVRRLVTHADDTGDPHIPLLVWWALEAHADRDRDAVLEMFASDKAVWDEPLVGEHILGRLMRRFALAGRRHDLLTCAELFELAPRPEHATLLMAGFEESMQGRSLAGLPDELVAAIARAGGGSLALRLRQAEKSAVEEALLVIADEMAEKNQRLELIRVVGDLPVPGAVPILLQLTSGAADIGVRKASLAALRAYDGPEIARQLIDVEGDLSVELRDLMLEVLASRRSWSLDLLAAVERGQVSADSIPLSAVRTILLHRDDEIARQIEQHWGTVRGATTAEMVADIERIDELLQSGSGVPHSGKALYQNSCGKCHKLFDDGGSIGPNLTAYKRDDLRRVLLNVVNPSHEIREGYETYVVNTDDGRTLSGFIADQDNQAVVLTTADGQNIVIRRDQIDEMAAIGRSIMPEGLLKPLADQQLRDLFAYLRATQPVP